MATVRQGAAQLFEPTFLQRLAPAGRPPWTSKLLATIRNHYRGATALGIHTNSACAGLWPPTR